MTFTRWIALSLAVVGLVFGCSSATPDPLDLSLDPTTNMVTTSPVPFDPKQGGVGPGRRDGLSFSRLVVSATVLTEEGASDCRQFVGAPSDLELYLFGNLKAGTYTLIPTAGRILPSGLREPPPTPKAGDAELLFGDTGGNDWLGTVELTGGSETRGARIRGTIMAHESSGKQLQISFDAPFAGCND